MKSNTYWINRANQRMANYHKNSDDTIKIINRAYDKAAKDIESDINKIFAKVLIDGNVNKTKRYLNQRIPNFLIGIMKEYYPKVNNTKLKKWMLTKINIPAYRARITRLEALKQSIYFRTKEIADIEINLSQKQYINSISDAYYRHLYHIQQGLGYGFQVASMDKDTITSILNNKWSGKHFSSRVWNNTDVLADRLTEVVTAGFMSGRSVQRMAREIEDNTRYGKYASERLIRTETTYMANEGEILAYKECEIEKYIYVATLDLRTSEICQLLDHKEFNVNKANAGVNLPPMHPFCRSTTRAKIVDETVEGMKRRARDPITGETYLVSQDINYKQWYDKYVVGVHGKEKISILKKMATNRSYDKIQFVKYRLIFKDKLPSTLDEFQELKYNDSKKWSYFKKNKQDVLNALDYSDMQGLKGELSNLETRLWYKSHDSNIPNLIDTTQPIKVQAQQAFNLRNGYRTQARKLMKDTVAREKLEKKYPNMTFDDLLRHKKIKYGLTDDEAYKDIIRSSQTTNKSFDKKAGIKEV